MALTPDTKNWTWVLERSCPECGFDASTVDVAGLGPALRATAERWVAILGAADVGRRFRADRWSPLEYGCHVRDVFVLFGERLASMLTEDDPLFANWDQDATAEAAHYDRQDPEAVRRDLALAGETLASAFDGVQGAQWERTGRRSDGARFTVASFGRYLLHDPLHHEWDVQEGRPG
ncbi:MAG TPA: DinB family protein [Acidimicrobiales bacterium]|jgi:hypothetical protein